MMSQKPQSQSAFSRYQEEALKYDRTKGEVTSVMGLVGEVGECTTVIKKHVRDRRDYYKEFFVHLREELGDALWYLTSVTNHYGLSLEDIATHNLRQEKCIKNTETCLDMEDYEKHVRKKHGDLSKHKTLALAKITLHAAKLIEIYESSEPKEIDIKNCLGSLLFYICTLGMSYGLGLPLTAVSNLAKLAEYFGDKDTAINDHQFPEEERLPRKFEVKFLTRENEQGQKFVKLQIGSVFVGDILNDNTYDEDYYRFHDAFHFAYAAILGWSPVIRSLLKVKRKSDPIVDENEDGARANIIEEAISLYVFTLYKKANSLKAIDQKVLKTIQTLTTGLEVQSCTPRQWRLAIEKGFAAFQQLIANNGGVLLIDLDKRLIEYKLEKKRK